MSAFDLIRKAIEALPDSVCEGHGDYSDHRETKKQALLALETLEDDGEMLTIAHMHGQSMAADRYKEALKVARDALKDVTTLGYLKNNDLWFKCNRALFKMRGL